MAGPSNPGTVSIPTVHSGSASRELRQHNKARVAPVTASSWLASFAAPKGKVKMWRPSGGVLPSSAPLPAVSPPQDGLPPSRPRPPEIPSAFLQPMPRRLKRGGGGGGSAPGPVQQVGDIEEAQASVAPPEAAGVQGRRGGLGLEEMQRSSRPSSKQGVQDLQQPGPNAAAGSYYLSATWEEEKAREVVSPQVGEGRGLPSGGCGTDPG